MTHCIHKTGAGSEPMHIIVGRTLIARCLSPFLNRLEMRISPEKTFIKTGFRLLQLKYPVFLTSTSIRPFVICGEHR